MLLSLLTHLENQLVWVDTVRQVEGGAQVPFQVRFFLNERQELRINSLLVHFPLLCHLVLLQIQKINPVIKPAAHFMLRHKMLYSEIQVTSFSVSKISPSW